MKRKIPLRPLAFCTGLFLILAVPQAHAQSSSPDAAKVSARSSSGFTTVVDSKIDPADTEVIRQLIAHSGHAQFLQEFKASTIYVLDLDQFKNGMTPFSIFGKQVKVIGKDEFKNLNPPFYLTIDGYHKRDHACSAKVSLHRTDSPLSPADSRAVELQKSQNAWGKK